MTQKVDAGVVGALAQLPVEQRRFALQLAEALGSVASDLDVSPTTVRNVLFRVVQAGLLQGRHASVARADLASALGPAVSDLALVPTATVLQAQRLATLRTSLLQDGAWTTEALATGRGTTPATARQWISRHRRSYRLFTVSLEGETLVPAFLLDAGLEPKTALQPTIEVLRSAGEDGWALWAWLASPSAWLDGSTPVEVAATDPARVERMARQRVAAAT